MKFFAGLLIGCAITGLAFQFLSKKETPLEAADKVVPGMIIDPGFNQPLEEFTVPEKNEEIWKQFQTAQNITSYTKETEAFQGEFSGEVSFESGEWQGRVDQLRLKIDLTPIQNILTGSVEVFLIDPKNESHSNFMAQGQNFALKLNPAVKDTLFIQTSASSFMAIDLTSAPNYFGHWYGKSSGPVEISKIK